MLFPKIEIDNVVSQNKDNYLRYLFSLWNQNQNTASLPIISYSWSLQSRPEGEQVDIWALTLLNENENRKATEIDLADLEYYLPEILDQLQLLAKSGHK